MSGGSWRGLLEAQEVGRKVQGIENQLLGLPGGPLVKIPCSTAGGASSIPSREN